MNMRTARPAAALLLGSALAAAQTPPDEPNQPLPVPGQVLSDVQPLPAEDRDSDGAVVLHDSRVRAQRDAAASGSGARTEAPAAIGRRVSRVLEQTRGWDQPGGPEPVPIPLADPAP